MKINKLSINGEKDSLEVTDKIFTSKINKKLISAILQKNTANFKGRKAKTKQKNEIIGSTAKIYAQKGTGNARHASRKAPIFIGGGVAHGPKGQSAYKTRKLNKKEKKLGLASIISEKAAGCRGTRVQKLEPLAGNLLDGIVEAKFRRLPQQQFQGKMRRTLETAQRSRGQGARGVHKAY